MSQAAFAYDQLDDILAGGAAVHWLTDDIKAALVTSAYTPDYSAHTQWADVSANEASGTNYTAGGVTLASKTLTGGKIDAADPTFSNVTITFRYVVLYANVTRNGLTDPLIGLYLPDDTPADIVVTASDWTLALSASGVVSYSQ